MSATPALTASWLSNGRTSAPAGKISILMRPFVVSWTVRTNRAALPWSPGVFSGQSVTIRSERAP